jgi:pilus assembly protein CpaB
MRFLLLFIAALIAVFAGISAMQLSAPAEAPKQIAAAQPAGPQNVSTVDVLVARAPIPPGTVLTPEMFDKQPWPEHLVLEGFIVGNSPNANVAGKVTRSAFQAREPLILSKLASVNDSGFLAASLPAGMRAITIATDAVYGVAGFVFPGDRVDIMFTHNIPQEISNAANAESGDAAKASGDKAGFAEVLAANIPVLAINLREGSTKDDAGNVISTSGTSALSSIAPSSMTLQVNDMQAEKIRLAEKVGTLSFVLRSISDRENPALANPADLPSLTRATLQEMVAAGKQEDSIKVIRSGDFGGGGKTHVQGGR